MTILRISLIAMISALFIFGGSRGADASARISVYCSEAYSHALNHVRVRTQLLRRPALNIARRSIAQSSEKPL
jgi:hypothetical protein